MSRPSVDRDVLKRYLVKFYRRCFSLYDAGQYSEISDYYLESCAELGELMPVYYLFREEISLPLESNCIIIANHIATPSLAIINEENILDEFGVRATDPFFKSIHPHILRHYPIINLLTRYDFIPHTISYSMNKRLDEINRCWGNIVIDKRSTSKTQRIVEAISLLPATHQGLIFFPEARDSHYYLTDDMYGLHPFKKGFITIAKIFKLPILSISLIFDRNAYTYRVRVNGLFYYNSYANTDQRKFIQKMEHIIAQGMRDISHIKND